MAWLKDNFRLNDLAGGFFARFLIFTTPHSDEIPDGFPQPIKESNIKAEEDFNLFLHKALDTIGDQREYILSPEARIIFHNEEIIEECINKYMLYVEHMNPKCLIRLFDDGAQLF